MKAMYYLLLECASKDEQSQKRGAVWVILNLGPNRQEDHPDQCQDLAQSNSFVQSVPLRFEGFHICSDAPQRKEFGTLAVAKACDRYRFRSRQHYGSLHELKLVLMSFGIPCSDNVFPRCEQDGYLEFPVESHLSWFRRKVEEEEKTKPPGGTVTTSSTGKSLKEDPGDIVETPGPLDVLVGRSTAIQKNPGNVKFYRLMDQMEKTYESLATSSSSSPPSTAAARYPKAVTPSELARWRLPFPTLARSSPTWISPILDSETGACTLPSRSG